MLIQLVGTKAAVTGDRVQFEPLLTPVSDLVMSESSAGTQPGISLIFVAVSAGIAIFVGRVIASMALRALLQQVVLGAFRVLVQAGGFVRLETTEAEQPLLAELPVGQPRALLHRGDDVSSDDDDDLSLGPRDPRERAAILGVTPPQTPPESEDSSEQPDSDSEPGDYGPNDDGNQELVELFAAVGEAAAADVLPALPLEPLQIRDDTDVWIAPISGTRFHLRAVCHGLRQASRIRGLTYRQMQNEYLARFDLCYYCQEWTRELADAHDVGTLATMFHFLHLPGQQVQQHRRTLPEPETGLIGITYAVHAIVLGPAVQWTRGVAAVIAGSVTTAQASLAQVEYGLSDHYGHGPTNVRYTVMIIDLSGYSCSDNLKT
ncbi:unnamed protein product, partial [Symbiodinium sp. KB8]